MTDDTKDLVGLLLHEKPVKIILAMAKNEETYPSQIAKQADCTFPHTLNTLKTLEEHGIVETEKTGRKKTAKLTSRGIDIAHDLAGLVRHLKEEKTGKKQKQDETNDSETTKD